MSDAPSIPFDLSLPHEARGGPSQIKPGRWYLASGILAIAISLYFISFSIASFWDFRASTPAWLVCLPFAVATGLLQYCAAFRQSRYAAAWLAILLIPASGFWLLLGLMATVDALRAPLGSLENVTVLAAFWFLGASGMVCGVANLEWNSCLWKCASRGAAVAYRPLFQFSLWRLFGWTVAAAACTGTTCWFVSQVPPRDGEHVTAAEAWLDLPDAATDICFWRGQGGRIAYEFTIDEASFREWVELLRRQADAKAEEVSLERIEEPCDIMRYCWSRTSAEDGGHATVSHSYYVQWSGLGSSWFPRIVYDRDAQRAYYDGYSR